MFKKKEKANKTELVMGIIGEIAVIVSIILIIINPNVSSYQDFFERSWDVIILFFIFLPMIVSNISAFSKQSKGGCNGSEKMY